MEYYSLDCIRNWRGIADISKETVRRCPLCRVESFFIVPSDTWVRDPDRKNTVIEKYKEYLSQVPCKHFDFGRGKCPFGVSCFYAHINPDGTTAPKIGPRAVIAADGHVEVFKEHKSLADYIPLRPQRGSDFQD